MTMDETASKSKPKKKKNNSKAWLQSELEQKFKCVIFIQPIENKKKHQFKRYKNRERLIKENQESKI